MIFISLLLWQTTNYILSSTSVILHPDKNQHLASFKFSFFLLLSSSKVKKVTWKKDETEYRSNWRTVVSSFNPHYQNISALSSFPVITNDEYKEIQTSVQCCVCTAIQKSQLQNYTWHIKNRQPHPQDFLLSFPWTLSD